MLFWVGTVAFASALVGPVWRWLNPVRTLYLLACSALRRDPREGLLPYPDGLGHWPAAVGLLAFGWLELVAPDRDTLTVLRAWFVAYLGLMALGSVVYGSRWFDRADGFQVASQLYGRVSALGRRADGAWVLRNPLDGLAATPLVAGLPAVVVRAAGQHGLRRRLELHAVPVRFVQGGTLGPVQAGTLGLVLAVLVVGALYALAVWAAGRLGSASPAQRRRGLAGLFAPSIVPIALGYVVAHYWSLFVLTGQSTVQHLADPLGTGADYLGLGGFALPYWLVKPSFVASLQVLAIVAGHVVGIVLAHDRAVSLFPRRRAVLGQVPLLVLMVCYTVAGLLLLFAA